MSLPSPDKVVVVGCGFVGSIFTTEFLKRMYAADIMPKMRFIDDDTVEKRNCANQNFHPSDIGTPKAEVMHRLAETQNLRTEFKKERLVVDNINALLEDALLIVDGVDNLATRQLLSSFARGGSVPVLHIGISEQGTGKVEWSSKTHTTFSLTPERTFGKTIADPVSGVTPPCELARMRGVGINAGFAAAIAASICLGFDPESFLEGKETVGYLTDWQAHPTGFSPIKELWSKI